MLFPANDWHRYGQQRPHRFHRDREFVMPNRRLAFALLALFVLGFFWLWLRKKTWPDRANDAQTVEAIAVTLALALAVLEYSLHFQSDIDREKGGCH
jgi:hypothetical protein